MDIQSARKSNWLANIGCALGVLSFGFITYAFIYPFVTNIDKHGLEAPLAIGFAVLFLGLIGLLLGLAGLTISLIALRRKIKEIGENTSKGIAILGLVLSGLVVATVCILLAYSFLFTSPVPPLPMITPSSIVPLPPG
jgi:uncharacterized membrane protein YidH (DUF202 family)